MNRATPITVVVLCPHFTPDTAPTGEVMTGIVQELTRSGARVHVVTALPWYRSHAIEQGWSGKWMRTEDTQWGSITRVNPFPGKDKRSLIRRAAGFLGFSALAGIGGIRAGGFWRRPHAIIAMSPPLTLGLTGWCVGALRRAPLIFNIQDVFPDAAVETGAITNKFVIACARWLERVSYSRSRAVVALSEDLRANIAAKLPEPKRNRVVTIPNFVDSGVITPLDRHTAYRRELGIGNETVVMYAGNVGFSQSINLLIEAARVMPDVTFVINGDGAARDSLRDMAHGLDNVRFADYQPKARLPEVLATADIHTVPLRSGLGSVSVPSKTYSILAAGRPVLAAIDAGTEVPRILEASGAGVVVEPDSAVSFIGALRLLIADLDRCKEMGRNGRKWVETHVSPAAVGASYLDVIRQVSPLAVASDSRD